MGSIIIGIVVAALIFYMVRDFFIDLPDAIIAIVATIIIIALFLGLTGKFLPDNLSEPKLDSTTKLVSLSDNTIFTGQGNMFYISISGVNSYTYYVEVESSYGNSASKAYKSKTITGDNVTIIESDEYTDAKLAVYKLIPQKDFWSFRLLKCPKYEYVFYVPKGTISLDISLGE